MHTFSLPKNTISLKDSCSKLLFWETAPMFRLLVPLVAGIAGYAVLTPGGVPPGNFIGVLILSLCLFLVTGIASLRRPGLKTAQFISVQLFTGLIGFGLCVQQDIRSRQNYMAHSPGRYPVYAAVLSADPAVKKQVVQLQLALLGGVSGQALIPVSGKAIVAVYKQGFDLQLHQGDTILLPGNWQPVTNKGNPFEFDYAGFCRRKQVYYQQLIRPGALSLWQAQQPSLIVRIHRYCIRSLEKYIPDTATAGLLKAMLAGDESGMDPELRQAYADTGIIHVISISGSHVNFLFLIVAILLRPLNKRYQWAGFLFSALLIWGYVLMAGAAPPAVRAALMFSIIAFGTLINRSSNPFNDWCAAAFLMLLYEPAWLWTTGFQLSFTAILSILIFYRPLRALWQPDSRLLRWLADGLALSIAAELLVAPLVAYYFHNFPLMFLIANLLACLAMMLLMLLGLILILLSGIPAIALLTGKIISLIAGIFHSIIFVLQRVSVPSLQTIALSPVSLCLIYLFITGMALWLLRRRKAGFWMALAAATGLAGDGLLPAWQSGRQKVLIVYNHTGNHPVELILGHSFFYSGDTVYEARNEARQAHTGYHSTEGYPLVQHLLIINDKTILLIDSNDRYTRPVPVHIAVISNWQRNADPADFIRGFHPAQVVLGAQLRRRSAGDWAKACADAGIALHDVREKGAYILAQE